MNWNDTRARLIECGVAADKLPAEWAPGIDLRWANLRWADLRWADLRWADLRGADLRGADLSEADLRWADLSGADLSGCTGLLDCAEWIARLESDDLGVIVYKRIGRTGYTPPAHWHIEPGAVLTEVVNATRTDLCSCGVNFGTREWCDGNYPDATLWRCRIRWIDLAGVVVPYNSDGKARCGRLELIEEVPA
jgi:uncharacterized protein YjbI with pentapeptide repeats